MNKFLKWMQEKEYIVYYIKSDTFLVGNNLGNFETFEKDDLTKQMWVGYMGEYLLENNVEIPASISNIENSKQETFEEYFSRVKQKVEEIE